MKRKYITFVGAVLGWWAVNQDIVAGVGALFSRLQGCLCACGEESMLGSVAPSRGFGQRTWFCSD